MKGFVLAAGFGTRLRPITLHLPKALVSVAGMPLLTRSLQFLINQGVDSIGVNSHYLSDQLERYKKNSSVPFELFYENRIRGTGGALFFAREFLAKDDIFIVVNVDIVCKFNMIPVIDYFKKSSFSCMLTAFSPENQIGSIIFDKQSGQYIGTTAENPNDCNGSRADFTGVTLYKKEFLELLTEDDFSIVPVWSRAFKKGMRTGVYMISEGYWRDVGTPDALAQIHFDTISNVIDMDVPDYLTINREKKYCIPRNISERMFSQIENSWVETESVGMGSIINKSVIFRDSRITEHACLINYIVTPWGAMRLEK